MSLHEHKTVVYLLQAILIVSNKKSLRGAGNTSKAPIKIFCGDINHE